MRLELEAIRANSYAVMSRWRDMANGTAATEFGGTARVRKEGVKSNGAIQAEAIALF